MKDSKDLTRRDFLKGIGVIFAGALALKFTQIFTFLNKSKPANKLKEAKFYKRTDTLAG